jgi:hypothetical protein
MRQLRKGRQEGIPTLPQDGLLKPPLVRYAATARDEV